MVKAYALERLDKDQKALSENIQKVYAAVPAADEKSEAIISMLEDMATKNRMIIDAIGIRQIPDSQIYYDDLLGFVGIYEFSGGLNINIFKTSIVEWLFSFVLTIIFFHSVTVTFANFLFNWLIFATPS